MPLLETIRAIHDYARDHQNAYNANNSKLALRLADVFYRSWDLGFTAFGGPPVHFGILHRRFVEGHGDKMPWIDEQTVGSNLLSACSARHGIATNVVSIAVSGTFRSMSKPARPCKHQDAVLHSYDTCRGFTSCPSISVVEVSVTS